jgi:hypothetical protein
MKMLYKNGTQSEAKVLGIAPKIRRRGLRKDAAKRLMKQEAQNVVLKKTELTDVDKKLARQHSSRFLRKYVISLDYDGDRITYPVYMVPHEFWGASWTKGYIEIDNDFPRYLIKPLSLHEACERHVCEKYGLNEHKEGHGVASEVERTWFPKHLGEEKWLQYGEIYDEVHRKEWNFIKGLMQ